MTKLQLKLIKQSRTLECDLYFTKGIYRKTLANLETNFDQCHLMHKHQNIERSRLVHIKMYN